MDNVYEQITEGTRCVVVRDIPRSAVFNNDNEETFIPAGTHGIFHRVSSHRTYIVVEFPDLEMPVLSYPGGYFKFAQVGT